MEKGNQQELKNPSHMVHGIKICRPVQYQLYCSSSSKIKEGPWSMNMASTNKHSLAGEETVIFIIKAKVKVVFSIFSRHF